MSHSTLLARRVIAIGLVVGVTGVVACKSAAAPLKCTADLIYAVNATIRDSTSGAPAADGAVLVGHVNYGSKTAVDTAAPSVDGLHLYLGALAGTYNLTIRKTGYATWTKNGLVITSSDGGCHPDPVSVDAELQPSP